MHAYSPHRVRNSIRKHFPCCPEDQADLIFARIMAREWPGLAIEHAVRITVHTHIRHSLTDYDRLWKKHGLTRDEARLCVREESEDIYAAWTGGIRHPPPLPSQYRKRHRL